MASPDISRVEAAAILERDRIIADLYYHPTENPGGFNPHGGQRTILRKLFVEDKERGLIVCGRNWGKTDVGLHVPGRCSLTREGVHPEYPIDQPLDCFYVAPTKELANEIVYSTGRIHRCVPKKYVKRIYESDKMIVFTRNGKDEAGHLKIIGTKDIYGLIGVKHGGPLIIDETSWTKPGWHDAKEEDYAAWKPKVLYFTTWPKTAPHFIDKMARAFKTNKKYFYIQRPSTDNPVIERRNPGYFKEQRKNYEAKGDIIGFKRDILSERVVGGQEFIFPKLKWETYREACEEGLMEIEMDEVTKSPRLLIMKDPQAFAKAMFEVGEDEHVWPAEMLWEYIEEDLAHMILVVFFDPGHSSRFAVNFDLYNPYTKEWFRVAEIYENRMEHLSVRSIMERLVKILAKQFKAVPPEKIRMGYDEAALWFKVELERLSQMIWGRKVSEYGKEDYNFFTTCRKVFGAKPWNLQPTNKKLSDEDSRIDTIREQIARQKVRYSDACPWSIWEATNFRLDEKGHFPAINNHTIDTHRYGLDLVGYSLIEVAKPKKVHPRVARFQDEKGGHAPEEKAFSDWFEP